MGIPKQLILMLNNNKKYDFQRPIFQPRDRALPLTGRGGYVIEDKINATIMVVMSYQLAIKWLPLILTCCIES